MRKIIPLLLFIFLVSCSSSSRIHRPEIQSEISISKLDSKEIVAINPNYKKSYYRLLPYLFFNENGMFNEIQGDFYNVKFNANSNINIMSGFRSDYGEYQNSLVVLIAMSNTSTLPIKDIPITIKSIKHGVFERGKLIGNNQINKSQQRVLFLKKLELENRFDILNKIKDDLITVTVGGQIYEFLNPEIKLD